MVWNLSRGRPAVLASLCLIAVLVPAAGATPDAEALGRHYTTSFFEGRHELIWQQMTDSMRRSLGSPGALPEFRARVAAGAGDETRIMREVVREQPGNTTYLRYSVFERSEVPVLVSWTFDAGGRIAGFEIRPQPQAAPSPYLDYQPEARLRLPFDGEWFVFWGGRSVEQNYHAAVSDQRFAYDFLVIENGASHSGDGTREADYYCWGRPVLAPADGKVEAVERLLADNPPGVMDAANPAGNHVILDLGNDEYAFLAHLKADSIVVEPGDDVQAGDTVGQCGNSGNTSEPHLHFHLQDGPVFGEASGLPVRFHNYSANGEVVESGEPVQGQTVTPLQ